MKKTILTITTILTAYFNLSAQTIQEVNNRVTSVNDRLTGQVQRIDGQVVRLDGQVQRIDGLVQKTDATNTRVLNAENRINSLQSKTANQTTTGSTTNFFGQVEMNGQLVRGLADGLIATDSKQAINGSQLHATNTRVTNLENTKADKSQVDALDNKVNTEVSRLDGRIDATNTRVDNLDNRVTTEVNRLDNEIVKTNNVVEANRITAANATAQVQTNLNTQVTRLDGRIDATNHNVSVLRSEVEVNHKKAMDADEQIRTDLRTSHQSLGDRVDGLGATMMAFGSMASSAVFDPKKRGNMSFGVGAYQKSVAYAVGVSYYTTPNTRVSLNFAGGNNSKLGAGVGASFGF
jgi:DNA repair exonuclease SbcCD ATPase subunit